MEAVRTSETSVHVSVTIRHYIPEDPKLQNLRVYDVGTEAFLHCLEELCVLHWGIVLCVTGNKSYPYKNTKCVYEISGSHASYPITGVMNRLDDEGSTHL
jgi:hypothetical protein